MKKDPEGYKKLLAYNKADELHWEVLKLTEAIERVERRKREVKGNVDKILLELAHQLGRAARSPLSNIAEGWKRNTTAEYYTFLGFSIASADEIKRDAEDIIRGKYKKLMGEKGIMGEKGQRSGDEAAGMKEVRGTGMETKGTATRAVKEMGMKEVGEMGIGTVKKIGAKAAKEVKQAGKAAKEMRMNMGMEMEEVSKIPFYPLNPLLPFVVKIYLRCKEFDYLLHQLQQSLETKMKQEGTLPSKAKFKQNKQQQDSADAWLKQFLSKG